MNLARKTTELFSKRFALLYILKTLLSLVGRLKNGKTNLKSVLLNISNAQFAISLSGVSSFYPLLLHILRKQGFREDYCPGLAGGLSSLWLLADRDSKRTRTISSLVFVRTLYFLIRAVVYVEPNAHVRDIEHLPSKEVEPVLHDHQTKVRTFGNKYIQYLVNSVHYTGHWWIWIANSVHACTLQYPYPELMEKGYYNTILKLMAVSNRYGPKYEPVVEQVSKATKYFIDNGVDQCIPIETTSLEYLLKLKSNPELDKAVDIFKGLVDPLAHHSRVCCVLHHPQHDNCYKSAFLIAWNISKSMAKTYFLYNLVSTLLSLYKNQKNIPHKVYRLLVDTLKMCLMISVFVGLFNVSSCSLRRIFKREHLIFHFLGGLCATPAILLDKPGRMVEMNAYCFVKVFDTLILYFQQRGFKYNRVFETLVMIPTVFTLTTILADHKHALRGFVVPPLKMIFHEEKY
ncbi:hypothetical protein HDV06_005676 [Boothiomyces sp. JEL0866]|nr:hypothetical protein HDV06_005676 [Boothiomyces sp. JEL0866]